VLVTGIKSKPVYAPLRADTRGRFHLMLAFGSGGVALLRVLAEMRAAAPELLRETRVLFIPDSTPGMPTDTLLSSTDPLRSPIDENPSAIGAAQMVDQFNQSCLAEVRIFGDAATLLTEFRNVLEGSLMGTRLYVAGPESFIGLAMKTALEFNLNKDEMRAEEMGSLARRVYCVHCRATTQDVRTNVVRCAGCERWLLVRDHYSRRLAAYMGVMVDAEVPGELPPIREIYV
jgi:hypothetical protein